MAACTGSARTSGPRRAADSKWIFRFESVNYRAKVWLNGKPIGSHVGSYLPFELRAKRSGARGVNRLVVRVDGRGARSSTSRRCRQRASGSFEGGWWNYTGILREVYLRKVTNLDFESVTSAAGFAAAAAPPRVTVDARVATSPATAGEPASRQLGRQARALQGQAGRRAAARHVQGTGADSPAAAVVPGPAASLHGAAAPDRRAGAVVQRYTVHTGIRTLRSTGSVGRAERPRAEPARREPPRGPPDIGAAIGRTQMRTAMGYLRRLGAHMTRSHYPLHPYFLELADRNGILVWSEIPVFRMQEHAVQRRARSG